MDSQRGNSTLFRNNSMTGNEDGHDADAAANGNSRAAGSRQRDNWPILRNSGQSESWAAVNPNLQEVDFPTAFSNPGISPYQPNGNPALSPYLNRATNPNQNLAASPYQALGNRSLYQPNENSAAGQYHGLFDSPNELGFSRLSLAPLPPAPAAYDTVAATAQPHLMSVRDIELMRLESQLRVRSQMELYALQDYQNPDNSENLRGHMGLYELQNYQNSDNSENLRGQMGLYSQLHNFDNLENLRGQMGSYSQLQNNQNFDNSEPYIRNLQRNFNEAAPNYTPEAIRNSGGRNLNINTGNSFSRYSSNGGAQPRQHSNGGAQPRQPHPNGGSRPRQLHLNVSSMRELRGRIFSMAKDQHGSKYLQDKIIEGKPEEIQMIFVEIKDRVCELMVHQFGNYLMQKFLDVCNQDQLTQLVMLVTDDALKFTTVCIDTHGSRFIQKLLEHLTTPEQKSHVISVLRRITVALMKSTNGHHIIQHCLNLKIFTNEENEDILNTVADNCLDIATDIVGCTVLQQCVGEATGEPLDRLLVEISSNALILSENEFGNYVVQFVLGLNREDITEEIMAQLSGNFVSLSMNKFGSHVVEKCLQGSEERRIIMQEIIDSPNFVRVLQDQYGNYVAQHALKNSQGEEIQKTMINMILVNYHNLQSHPYGKRVLPHTRGSNRFNSRFD